MSWASTCDISKINNIIIKNAEIIENKEIHKENNITTIKKFDISDTINDMISDKILDKYNSLELLNYQLELSNNLNKYYYLNNNILKKNIILILEKLKYISNILKIRGNLSRNIHNINSISQNYIPRCSYKFCVFKDNCKYNYSKKCKNGCFSDHFVHDLVYCDISIIIIYINKYTDDNNIINNKDINKSFSTINFVIKHMCNELNNLNLYVKDINELESIHKKKNTVKKKKLNKKRSINI